MLRCRSEKARKVEDILSKRLGEIVQVRKGAPDARYSKGYFAYMVTMNGFQAVGTYGEIYRYSKTLQGLLN